MRVGGWRTQAWGGIRADLVVSVGALVLASAAPTALVSQAITPGTGTVTVTGWTPSRGDQPAVRWSSLSRQPWARRWGPYPDQGSSRHDRLILTATVKITTTTLSLGIADLPAGTVSVTGWSPTVAIGGGLPVAGGPKLVWRSGLHSYIGKLVWGPTGGSVNDTAKATPPTRVTIASDPPTVAIDDSANDRTCQISWVEFETPNADRRVRVSWAAFETPDAPVRARISWAEFQVPDAPRRLRVSWAEFSTPDAVVAAERRLLVSWAALEVPVPIDLTSATPPLRTWVVPRESRTWVVPRETRTWKAR